MAKQLVGPLERNIEKGILALTGLLLIGVVAMYVVTSPNQRDLDGKMVTPGTIDATLVRRAKSVQNTIRQASTDVDPVEALFPAFGAALDSFQQANLGLTLSAAVPIGPDVPLVDQTASAPGQVSLVEVVPLSQTKATSGRSTVTVFGAVGRVIHPVTNWVTVSAVFDVKKQMALQRAEYGAAQKELVFGIPQLQRRAQQSDGSWSDADWVDVEPWANTDFRPPPVVRLGNLDGELVIEKSSEDLLEQYFDDLSDPAYQLALLRPFMWEIENGSSWSFPILTSRKDVVLEDQEFIYPDDPTAAVVDRYTVVEAVNVKVVTKEKVPWAERKKQHLEAYAKFMESAWIDQDSNDARRAYNEAAQIKKSINASAADKEKAVRLMADATERERDIDRRKKKVRARNPGGNKGPVQVQEERQPFPIQQIWVHDATPGSVMSGRTYQYRLRPTLYNRLAGEPAKYRNKTDAATVFLAGEWTQPIEVSIPYDTVFFVTSMEKRKGTVKLEFFKWEEGVWVKSRRFSFGVGDHLKGECRVRLPTPGGSGEPFNALVEFEADATIIDIDFERPYRERKRPPSSKSGVKFSAASAACSVVFLDGSGRLHERFVPTDKANPERKEMGARLYKPK